MILPPPSPVPHHRHTLAPPVGPSAPPYPRSSHQPSLQFRWSHVQLLYTGFANRCDRILRRAVALDPYLPNPPSLLIYPTPSQGISRWPSANHAAILSYSLLSLTPFPADSADPCRCPALRSVQVRGTACHWLARSGVDDALVELCEAC